MSQYYYRCRRHVKISGAYAPGNVALAKLLRSHCTTGWVVHMTVPEFWTVRRCTYSCMDFSFPRSTLYNALHICVTLGCYGSVATQARRCHQD
jgi:hypothetical protein